MLSQDTAQQSSSPADPKAGADTQLLDSRSVIETASGGSGPANDPSGTDQQPPGISDLDLLA
jgi:hypothetical protein